MQCTGPERLRPASQPRLGQFASDDHAHAAVPGLLAYLLDHDRGRVERHAIGAIVEFQRDAAGQVVAAVLRPGG